jgi:hypothetical protein
MKLYSRDFACSGAAQRPTPIVVPRRYDHELPVPSSIAHTPSRSGEVFAAPRDRVVVLFMY